MRLPQARKSRAVTSARDYAGHCCALPQPFVSPPIARAKSRTAKGAALPSAPARNLACIFVVCPPEAYWDDARQAVTWQAP